MKCKTIISFATAKASYAPSDIAELDEREAERLAAAGIVEILGDGIQTAEKPQAEVEQAVLRSKSKRSAHKSIKD